MRDHCSEDAVLPWEHPPTASEAHRSWDQDSEVQAGPQDHLVQGPAARAQLERDGDRPQLGSEQDQADHPRLSLWGQSCLLLLT